MSDFWAVKLPELTESQAAEIVSFGRDGLGLSFAYAYDPRKWMNLELDVSSVRCIVDALRTATLDDCSATFLEDCEEWLQAHEDLEPDGEVR